MGQAEECMCPGSRRHGCSLSVLISYPPSSSTATTLSLTSRAKRTALKLAASRVPVANRYTTLSTTEWVQKHARPENCVAFFAMIAAISASDTLSWERLQLTELVTCVQVIRVIFDFIFDYAYDGELFNTLATSPRTAVFINFLPSFLGPRCPRGLGAELRWLGDAERDEPRRGYRGN